MFQGRFSPENGANLTAYAASVANVSTDEHDAKQPNYKLNKEHVSAINLLRAGEKAYFAWSDVNFTLSPKTVKASAKDPRVLRNLQGFAAPGEVVAIMGSSGGGKTSLLNVLSGRVVSMNGHVVTGKFTINGVDVKPENLGNKVAFVTQEDCLCPTATPREAFELSARLRLPPSVTAEERRQLVNEVIEVLRLEKCADTMIGDEMIKGISGGEKRRTSIGVELITTPSILFLDEPTSGLDSFGAYVVVNILRDLARTGCTVLCTIHQPSSEVFHCFDRAILMAQGRTFYDGGVHGLSAHLARLDLPVPDETNPADHVMFIMQTLERDRLQGFCDEYEAGERDADPHAVPAQYAATASGSLPQREQAGLLTQFIALSKRNVQTIVRDKGALVARVAVNVVLSLLTGVIFLGAADSTKSDYDINTHFGALLTGGISGMFGAAQPVLLQFPAERPRFVREYATGSYSALAYFTSKMVTELPFAFIDTVLSYLIVYWMMGYNGSFILLVVATWLLAIASASTALFFGCLVASVQEAVQTVPVIFVPQILFAGIFVRLTQIPAWIRWAEYLCSLKFGMNLLVAAEFTLGQNPCAGPRSAGCEALASSLEVHRDLWWAYGLILVGIFFAFRVLALGVLVRKARGFALA